MQTALVLVQLGEKISNEMSYTAKPRDTRPRGVQTLEIRGL